MKKALALLLAVITCLSLAACGATPEQTSHPTGDATAESSSAPVQEYQIPVLHFEGDISEMNDKSDVRSISVQYEDGDRSFQGYAELKVQGTSSLAYAKKNYTIKFYKDDAHTDALAVDMGWGAQNKYCLKANWIDRTHARNVVTAKLVSEIQDKYGVLTQAPRNGAVDGFPIEIYINSDFLGIYTFNIPKDTWQFGMDSDNPDHIVICGEGWEPANLFRGEPDFETWEVEIGEDSEATLEKMKALFSFVQEASDEDFVKNFETYIDLDAALNYYILVDFAYLPDNCGKNMLIATYDGTKWYPSLYDLDTSWGADYIGRELYDYKSSSPKLTESLLFERMTTHFSRQLAERYFELREDGIFTKEHVMDMFNQFRDQIPASSFDKEIARWGTNAAGEAVTIPGFDYEQIEQYLDVIIPRLDAKYSAMLTPES